MDSPPISTDVFLFLKDLIYHHSGIHLTEKEAGVLQARVARRVRELGLGSGFEYAALLRGPGADEELPALLDAVTINYTFFFRENQHFQMLGTEVLPRLLRGPARNEGRIRAWSAGCSSGEEPYSIAMTFAEAARDAEDWDFRILATDINRRVLRVGHRGIYPVSRLTTIPQEYRYKYLVRDGETPSQCLRISEDLRRLAVFRRLNILQEVEDFRGAFDFVFCRNVMIYFDPPSQIVLLRRFHAALKPKGYLFVGSTESYSGIPHPFHFSSPGVYRKG